MDKLLVPGFGQVGYVEDCEKRGNHPPSDRNPHFVAVWHILFANILKKKKKKGKYTIREKFSSQNRDKGLLFKYKNKFRIKRNLKQGRFKNKFRIKN